MAVLYIVLLFATLRFRACCENTFQASMDLVSRCSGIKPVYLEAQYRKMCSSATPSEVDYEVPPEEVEEAACLPTGEQESCQDVLEQLQQEANFVKTCTAEEDLDVAEDREEREHVRPDNLENLPDGELLQYLIKLASVAEAFGSELSKSPRKIPSESADYLPSTLREALKMPGDWFNCLFRHIVRLRSARGGMDTLFVKNARSCRRASKKLNWYQLLV